jgi:hypothetical protein
MAMPVHLAAWWREHPERWTFLRAAALSLGLSVPAGLALSSYAQPPPTREQVEAELSRVGQNVWHARLTSDLNAQLYQAWMAGETAFYKGDYAKAMKKLKQADAMAKQGPNDYGE